jgi:hypothetical protein
LDKNRKKFDIREEYFVAFGSSSFIAILLQRLSAVVADEDWAAGVLVSSDLKVCQIGGVPFLQRYTGTYKYTIITVNKSGEARRLVAVTLTVVA